MSPSLGAASVRVQGLRGRYTRILSDGLPLFGDVGGLDDPHSLASTPGSSLDEERITHGIGSSRIGGAWIGGRSSVEERQGLGEIAIARQLSQPGQGVRGTGTRYWLVGNAREGVNPSPTKNGRARP